MSKLDLSRLDMLSQTSTPADTAPSLSTMKLDEDEQVSLEGTVLRLSDYLQATEMVIKETFSHHVWVKAEIRNLSSKGGHYYFELAEKEDTGKVIASCRGNLWRFKASSILAKFERMTGMPLSRDLMVLLKVNATFHPQYGFSLNIHDIDPTYTLGDLARQYNAMLECLAGEGLLTLNKSLAAPFDIEHVIVIAPEKAAGLGDFQADANRLSQTGACHFHYHHATFQGNHAPTEIRQAISNSMQDFYHTYQRQPDLMVIIRGGGAVGDLAYLNDYELAALIAEQPIPVWVGIGHERDRVILDEVAHTSFDTPSKVIAAIQSHLLLLIQQTQRYAQQIQNLSHKKLQQSQQQCEQRFFTIKAQSQHTLALWYKDSQYTMHQITQYAQFHLQQAQQLSQQYIYLTQENATNQIRTAKQAITQQYTTLYQDSYRLISNTKTQLSHYQQLILVQHPNRVLKQGYALIKDAKTQQTIPHSHQLYPQQNIQIQMQDGQVTATIHSTYTDKK
ncbi:exodeoxyribonuclease VII large subunit [Psychrobacter sp. I-STPA6b]|uniref:exodeoxyribonuclease VII large subunit n=1 Tax=Psychrobacter sp. I-STPA6b TaxID=2585718 RepID=UPI001D0C4779|nr:exodeoxyribonuclease VII large subunit [Psychrobacter sp. I-STPA6b]